MAIEPNPGQLRANILLQLLEQIVALAFGEDRFAPPIAVKLKHQLGRLAIELAVQILGQVLGALDDRITYPAASSLRGK
jgi:hypothetical protein